MRLASAAIGQPREPSDLQVLSAVRQAGEAGVAFPLSVTHYQETARIAHPRQRADLASTMASISHSRTFCSGTIRLRHQFLEAMHLSFGRPAFRPAPPQPLGMGAAAFRAHSHRVRRASRIAASPDKVAFGPLGCSVSC